MIKITDGVNIFEVTRGAFDGIYSHQGYSVLEEDTIAETEQNESVTSDNRTSEEIFVEEILKKPISQWNKEEAKEFINIKGIDVSNAKKFDEVKELIKAFLDKEAEEVEE